MKFFISAIGVTLFATFALIHCGEEEGTELGTAAADQTQQQQQDDQMDCELCQQTMLSCQRMGGEACGMDVCLQGDMTDEEAQLLTDELASCPDPDLCTYCYDTHPTDVMAWEDCVGDYRWFCPHPMGDEEVQLIDYCRDEAYDFFDEYYDSPLDTYLDCIISYNDDGGPFSNDMECGACQVVQEGCVSQGLDHDSQTWEVQEECLPEFAACLEDRGLADAEEHVTEQECAVTCRTQDGAGLCIDEDECRGSQGQPVAGFCPGAGNIQCCLFFE